MKFPRTLTVPPIVEKLVDAAVCNSDGGSDEVPYRLCNEMLSFTFNSLERKHLIAFLEGCK